MPPPPDHEHSEPPTRQLSYLDYSSLELKNNLRAIRELPASEQPLYRLQRAGASALSCAELLQIVLGTNGDSARELMATFNSLSALARADAIDLLVILGIGPSRAARIQAVFELARRQASESPEERPQIKSPADLARLLIPEMSGLLQEQMRVVWMNQKHRVIGSETVYQGSVHTTVVRVGELFRQAIRQNCPCIALAHNHPSGDQPDPSPEDVALTRECVKAGNLLDVEIVDHLVISGNGFVSLRERGLGFNV